MKIKQMPYINREISWLSFNERVLQEAADKTTPIIERLKFLGIFSNNRDEFYRVRVATVKRLLKLGKSAKEIYGESPEQLLARLQKRVITQQRMFDRIYSEIKKELERHDIYFVNETQLSESQKTYVRKYFIDEVTPVIFPIMIDDSKPFPYMKDKASYLYIKLQLNNNHKKFKYALIEIPSKQSNRFVILPKVDNKNFVIMLDDVIRQNTDLIFNVFGFKTVEAYNIKLTRDAELEIDNDVSKSMVEKISKSLKARKQGSPVRFVYDSSMPEDMLRYIMRKQNMSKKDNAIPGGRYHNFKEFISFPQIGDKSLVYRNPKPIEHKYLKNNPTTILKSVSQKDILLHYPYHSFNHVINLLIEASIDPIVESIKITLYRVAESSRIATALINAIKNGKKVTVLVELQARFDEENNIYWAKKLNEEGANVIYGVAGLKVHSKLFLITTKEANKQIRYAHIGTGNFNEKTAKIYTDFSLLTANPEICNEVSKVFDFYENNFKVGKFKHLAVAPFFMRKVFIGLINNEIKNAKKGKPSGIVLKMNSLVDKEMISYLYLASNAGVPIKLIVRGACSLVTEMQGWSENIEAISIVDKYLEHARVFIFHNDGQERMYISSADWMSRNLDSRSEVAVPIYNEEIREQIKEIIKIQLSGNTKVRIIDKNQLNKYRKQAKGEAKIRVQNEVYKYLQKSS
ncbi:MAG: polyphosphate kinase 1 [Bacteroidia bacterium]